MKLVRRAQQAGFTLIELLVSLTLGALVLGAVVALYSNTSGARTQSQAIAEMNEDGLYALRILTQQIRLAGFNPLQPGRRIGPADLEPARNPAPGGTSTLPIFGCSSSFSNAENTTSTFTGTSISALTCDASNTASHAIAVTYEADVFNTIPTAANVPTDCKGDGLPAQTTTPALSDARVYTYYYADNRFYLKNNALYCTGNGGSATTTFAPLSQPLVDNVEQLNFQYGVMPPSITNTVAIPAGYLDASQIGSASGIDVSAESNLQTLSAINRWSKVTSVRICVLMRSRREVLVEPAAYYGCDPAAAVIVSTDRFARRAFFSTVNIRNSRAD
jgi:type IV pilus assembly protein PilW